MDKEKKKCFQCDTITDDFPETNKSICRKCIKENNKKRNTTNEGVALSRLRRHISFIKKKINITTNYKLNLNADKIKTLIEKVFQNKSFLDCNPLTPLKNKWMVWFITLKKPFITNNMFVCTESEFEYIMKNGKELRDVLDKIYPDSVKSKEEKDQMIEKIHDYDQLKKDNKIWVDYKEAAKMENTFGEMPVKKDKKRKRKSSSSKKPKEKENDPEEDKKKKKKKKK